MGRPLPKKLSQLGWRILARLKELHLEPLAVAAAAGIAPSTLYRLMKEGKPGEATIEPRLRTKRRLARVLKVSLADLFDDSQLEILTEPEPPASSPVEPLERLIIHHYRRVSPALRGKAISAAVTAVVDYALAVAVHDPRPHLPPLGKQDIPGSRNDTERLILSVFRRLPISLRPEAARFMVQSMIDVQLAAGDEPKSSLFQAAERARWSEARLLRDDPPLGAGEVA